MKSKIILILAVSLISLSVFSAEPKSKYGPEATVLSQSHEYFQKHAAPGFWSLIPYYQAQQDDRSCSVASVAMVVNAARVGKKLTADDELVTQSGLLKRLQSTDWPKWVGTGGHGVTLDQLRSLVENALKSYGVEGATVQVVHTTDASAQTKALLHKALVASESSPRAFIIINFIQGAYTGDADVGHIAPVGAYDSGRKRVLVLDPDRQWYEPYWVSEETLIKGMVTHDNESGISRGYLLVELAPKHGRGAP